HAPRALCCAANHGERYGGGAAVSIFDVRVTARRAVYGDRLQAPPAVLGVARLDAAGSAAVSNLDRRPGFSGERFYSRRDLSCSGGGLSDLEIDYQQSVARAVDVFRRGARAGFRRAGVSRVPVSPAYQICWPLAGDPIHSAAVRAPAWPAIFVGVA